MCLAAVAFAACVALGANETPVGLSCAEPTVAMGDTVVLDARVAPTAHGAVDGVQLLPYVDGRRWGHHARTNAEGRAVFRIPMPRPGRHEVRVVARDADAGPSEFWIWPADRQSIEGPVWLQRVVTLSDPVEAAEVWLAADDEVRLYVNGVEVAHKTGWNDNAPVALAQGLLRVGENVLSAWANNGGGPAGVLMRLELAGANGEQVIATDDAWRASAAEPPGWPAAAAPDSVPVALFGRANENPAAPRPWPGLGDVDPLYVTEAATLPEDAVVSEPVIVEVLDRALVRPSRDPEHLVCVQWEPWFTPLNAWWATAQGVPLLGFYHSLQRDITRQHVIWFIESGVDYIMADWSNHIWFSKSWNDIGPGNWELIDATTAALDELAAMRDEGHDVPRFTLLTGISHVSAPDGPRAVNEQLAWIHDNYVANPKYAGLWQEFDGKPLILPLNLGASYLRNGYELDDRFAIRFVGAGTDHNAEAQLGLWSWMDHCYPAAPMKDGVVEAMTASVGSFEGVGWLGDRARGRRNGATLVEDWNVVMDRRPQVVQLHQFNEFTGAREGQAHGPGKDQYYDSYSIALSDDFEPVALDQAAYRGEDGYGFYYLNLVRALVSMYREDPTVSTALAIQRPVPTRPGFSIKPVVRGDTLELVWTWAGVRPETFRVSINGETVLDDHPGTWADINVSAVPQGEMRVRVTGIGAQTRYPLCWDRAALPIAAPEEPWAEVLCVREP